jgi:aryl-phospho-beta-D-glucosidase BglC (GH1 family)
MLEGRAMMAGLVPGFEVSDEWGSGFNGDVVLANTSAMAVEGWRVQFDYQGEIATLWNGVIAERQGSTFTVTSALWNAVVAPGGSVSFGFTAASAPSTTVTNLVVLDAGGSPANPTDDSGHTSDGGDMGHDHHDGGHTMPSDGGMTDSGFIDLASFGMSSGSDHTHPDDLTGGRTRITTEALVAYNGLRDFLGLEAVELETVGQWAYDNQLTNNSQAWGNDLKGVGLYYALQGSKVGWIRDAAFDPQILADIQRTARLGAAADALAMVEQFGHAGLREYLAAEGLEQTFVNTLKMEPHYAGWMHDRCHGWLEIEGVAIAHDVNHLTVLSYDQTQPFMNDTFEWPQWPALQVSHAGVIEYFQSMLVLGDPVGQNLVPPSGSQPGGPVDDGGVSDPPPAQPPAVDPPPEVTLPLQVAFSVADIQVEEGTLAAAAARGPLATSGNQIVDAAGSSVRIAGVNWFGMETTTFAPHGLWARGYREMMDQMKSLGFNTIRLPYSDQLFDASSTPNGIDFSKNADLAGLSGLEVMDALVSYADEIGLWLILDHHRSDAGNSASETGLWWSQAYPESVWIDNLTMLASRYAASSSVVGIDLHNEPHGPATWGDGSATDWRLAAERAGNAVLAANPNLLIIVEGIERASSGSYWWGGNLSNAGDSPVRLNVADRLVYSPHDYPASVYEQPYFADPDYPANLPDVWDANWGYLFREGIAPVMLGEFGSTLETASDRAWFSSMIDYLGGDFDGDGSSDLAAGEQGISWTYWSWNPNSGDTGGILADDWSTPVDEKLSELTAVQFPLGSHDPGADVGTQVGRAATFTIQLDRAYDREVTLSYVTQAGTATAGVDFTSQLGRVTFAPGQTSRQVSVLVMSDAALETNETFSLQVAAMAPAVGERVTAIATILDDDLSLPEGATPPVAAPSSPPAAPPAAGDPPPAAPPADMPPESLAAGVVAIERSRWHDGLVVDLEITAPRAVDDWRLSFEFDGEIVNIWNANIVSRDGSRYTIAPLDYTASLAAGQTIVVGFQGAGIDSSLPSGFS